MKWVWKNFLRWIDDQLSVSDSPLVDGSLYVNRYTMRLSTEYQDLLNILVLLPGLPFWIAALFFLPSITSFILAIIGVLIAFLWCLFLTSRRRIIVARWKLAQAEVQNG